MNLTLILTRDCNMACRYCFESHCRGAMSREVIDAAAALAVKGTRVRCGFSLFGGEPLLRRDLVQYAVRRLAKLCKQAGVEYNFNMTTNGLLLDEAFLRFADKYNIRIALSWDGMAQDDNRLTVGGYPTSGHVQKAWERLRQHQPDALVMYTVGTNAVDGLAQSVSWLFDRGVQRLNLTPDARACADWNDGTLHALGVQYLRIGEDYARRLIEGQDIHLLNFDDKLRSYIHGTACGHDCMLGKRQPVVTPDGGLYPCIQFADDPLYRYGSVFSGIDPVLQTRIYERSRTTDPDCADCPVASRCRHTCPCLNFQQTGDMNRVSDTQCRIEQLLITAADRAGELLCAADSTAFAERFYRTAPVHEALHF